MNLGGKIKARRRQLNLSQEKLAEMVNVHSNTIRKWEKNESTPDIKLLQPLAEALQTTTTYLCEEKETENHSSFIKNSAYQDKTEIQDSMPSMAYWGSLVDNAEIAAQVGKNLDAIVGLVNTALRTLQEALLAQQKEHNENALQSENTPQSAFVLGSTMAGVKA